MRRKDGSRSLQQPSPELASAIDRVAAWTTRYTGPLLRASAIPGTTEHERRRLSALGSVLRSLALGDDPTWPGDIRAWIEGSPPAPADVAQDLQAILHADPSLLALLYENLVSSVSRRRLGTFFTPTGIVDFLLSRAEALLGPPGMVIDPGAGVGAITIAARRRWRSVPVKAVDVNVVTLALLAASSASHNIGHIEFILEDYLSWIATPFSRETGPMLILGNPPYTRYQDLEQEIMVRHREAAGSLVKSGLAGLSAYFLDASVRSLRPEDGLAFVLPGNWTEARYGAELRKALFQHAKRRVELYPFPLSTVVFPGTLVSALILVLGPESSPTRSMHIGWPRLEHGAVTLPDPVLRHVGDEIPERLGPLLWLKDDKTRSNGHAAVPLVNVARVRRGVATGANSFFFLTDAQRRGLPEDAVVPALTRLSHFTGATLTRAAHDEIGRRGYRRWLLRLGSTVTDERLRRLIAEGELLGLHRRYLTALRRPWYSVEHVEPPDILVASMAKGNLRAVNNELSAIPSNSIYGIYLTDKSLSAAALAKWLSSSYGQTLLRSVARHYAGGLYKLEPRDLLKIQIPEVLWSGMSDAGLANHEAPSDSGVLGSSDVSTSLVGNLRL